MKTLSYNTEKEIRVGIMIIVIITALLTTFKIRELQVNNANSFESVRPGSIETTNTLPMMPLADAKLIEEPAPVPVLLGFLKTCRVNPGYRFHGPTALQSLHRLGTVAVSHHSFTVGFTVYGAGTEFVSVHCLQDNLLQNSESFGRWRRTDCHSSRHPILSRRG